MGIVTELQLQQYIIASRKLDNTPQVYQFPRNGFEYPKYILPLKSGFSVAHKSMQKKQGVFQATWLFILPQLAAYSSSQI